MQAGHGCGHIKKNKNGHCDKGTFKTKMLVRQGMGNDVSKDKSHNEIQ